MRGFVTTFFLMISFFCYGQYIHESELVSAPYINYLQDFDTLDFNNDGQMDFIVVGGYDDDVVLLLYNGNAKNYVRQRLFNYDDERNVTSISSININNDEFMDMAVYSWICFFNQFTGQCLQTERIVDFFVNLNGEEFQLANSVLLEEENIQFDYNFIKRDVNSDGNLDLLMSGSNYAFITETDSTLDINDAYLLSEIPRLDDRIKYFDFNTNGENEVVYVDFINNIQYLIIRDSASIDTLIAEPYSVLRPIRSTHIMDYDFDNNPDLFVNFRDSIVVFTHTELGWSSEFQTVYVNTSDYDLNELISFSLPNESANFFIVQADTFPRVISQNTDGLFVNHSIIYNPFRSEMIGKNYIVDINENDSSYIIYTEPFIEIGGGILSESILTSFKGRKEENSIHYYRNILGDQHDKVLFVDDINGDGLEDLVCFRSFYLQDSTNNETGLSYFASAEPIIKKYDEDNLNLRCYGVTDVNNDGKQEFLLAPIANVNDSNRVVCITYEEDQPQSNIFNMNLGGISNYAFSKIYEADLDNDEVNELIVKTYNGIFGIEPIDTNFIVLKLIGNEYLPFYYGYETIEDFSISSDIGFRSLYYSAAISDVNNDSFKDIIFIGGQNGVVAFIIYINNSDGSFESPQIIQFESEIFSFSAFDILDLNFDGNKDIIIAQNNSDGQGFLKVKYGLGGLEFSEPEELIIIENARIEDFKAIDLDQDGELEILISTFTSQSTFEDSLNHGLRLFKRQSDEYLETYTFAQSNPPRTFVLSEAEVEQNIIRVYTNDASQKLIQSGWLYDFTSEVSQHVLTKDLTTQVNFNNVQAKDKLIIYPNPGASKFSIINNFSHGETPYYIYTTTGQLVSQGNVSSSQPFYVDLPDALYILKINDKHALFSVVHSSIIMQP